MTLLFGLFFGLLVLVLLVLVPVAARPFRAPIAIGMTLLGVGVYALVGAPEIIPLQQERSAHLGALAERMRTYQAKVAADERDVEGWVGLGSLFMESGQYDTARGAFRKAILLTKGDPRVILAYAKAIIASEDGTITPDAKKSLEMVLLQDKANPEAQYYIAVAALQEGRNEEAMKQMKALYHSLPEDSPVKALINQQIGR